MLQLLSKKDISVQKIYDLSSIDPWFIEKIKNIVETEEKLKQNELDKPLLHNAKKLGFLIIKLHVQKILLVKKFVK